MRIIKLVAKEKAIELFPGLSLIRVASGAEWVSVRRATSGCPARSLRQTPGPGSTRSRVRRGAEAPSPRRPQLPRRAHRQTRGPHDLWRSRKSLRPIVTQHRARPVRSAASPRVESGGPDSRIVSGSERVRRGLRSVWSPATSHAGVWASFRCLCDRRERPPALLLARALSARRGPVLRSQPRGPPPFPGSPPGLCVAFA